MSQGQLRAVLGYLHRVADSDSGGPDDAGIHQRLADVRAVLIALEESLRATEQERLGPTTFLDTAARVVFRFASPGSAPSAPLIV